MWYIKNIYNDRYYSGFSDGEVIWKNHWSRAVYSSEYEYMQGVVDTLIEVLPFSDEEDFIIEWFED